MVRLTNGLWSTNYRRESLTLSWRISRVVSTSMAICPMGPSESADTYSAELLRIALLTPPPLLNIQQRILRSSVEFRSGCLRHAKTRGTTPMSSTPHFSRPVTLAGLEMNASLWRLPLVRLDHAVYPSIPETWVLAMGARHASRAPSLLLLLSSATYLISLRYKRMLE